jgi:hypothetical protein
MRICADSFDPLPAAKISDGLTCLTCLTTQQAPPPLLPLAGAWGRGMWVVTAQRVLTDW